MRRLRVLSLFSGTGSFTTGFTSRGHDVVHVDLYEAPDPDTPGCFIKADVKDIAKDPEKWLDENVDPGWRPDIIVGGPLCTAFSMAGSGSRSKGSKRWRYDGPFKFFGPRLPTDETSRIGCSLPVAMLHIIRVLKPRWWWLENPMAGLRTMGFMEIPRIIEFTGMDAQNVTITYCQYSDPSRRMKPTDLWGCWPKSWSPRPRCKNGDPCHVRAPRGAKTGTQGIKGARERGRVPIELSREIAIACERELS